VTNPIEDNTRDAGSKRRMKVAVGIAIGLVLIGLLCLALGVPLWVIAIGIGAFLLFVIFEA
jgi:heme A synthase